MLWVSVFTVRKARILVKRGYPPSAYQGVNVTFLTPYYIVLNEVRVTRVIGCCAPPSVAPETHMVL